MYVRIFLFFIPLSFFIVSYFREHVLTICSWGFILPPMLPVDDACVCVFLFDSLEGLDLSV